MDDPAVPMPAVGALSHVFVDAHDPEQLAGFWALLLGTSVGRCADPYVLLEPLPSGLVLGFQRVPEAKAGKARIHVDLTVADLPVAVGQAVGLGASPLSEDRSGMHRWRVMADPEGNEFCLITPLEDEG